MILVTTDHTELYFSKNFLITVSPFNRCRQYYRCSGGVLLQREECPAGMIFNGIACVSHSTYVCPADGAKECSSNQRGFFQDVQSGCRRCGRFFVVVIVD